MLLFKILLLLSIVLEFVFVPLFLKAMWPNKTKKSLALKMICATLFLFTGLLAVKISGNSSEFAALMLLGLLFGFLGDFFLHVGSKLIYFILGLLSFWGGHLFYISAYWSATGKFFPSVRFFDPAEISFILLLYGAFIAYSIMKKADFGKALVPVLIYAASLIIMFVKAAALGIRFAAGSKPGALMICVFLIGGAMQFLISDTLWATINFMGLKKNRPMKNANIITYFGAQIFLACTILVIK